MLVGLAVLSPAEVLHLHTATHSPRLLLDARGCSAGLWSSPAHPCSAVAVHTVTAEAARIAAAAAATKSSQVHLSLAVESRPPVRIERQLLLP